MLSSSEKRQLRQRAHHLKPVVLVGQQGLSEAVMAEIDRALVDHELIKVRFRGSERDSRKAAFQEIATALGAEFVSSIGAVAILFRQSPQV